MKLLGISGGIGKNIAATGAVKLAVENEVTVDVITAHPTIWQGNPHVNKVYDWNRIEYLHEKIKDYDEVILQDPYRHSKFLLEGCDLTCTWNYMVNGICEPAKPEIFLNKAEKLYVEGLLQDIKKPILAVQTNGGLSEGYAWNRDIPLEEAVEVLNHFQEDYEIIHLRMDGQLEIKGIKHTAELNMRQALVVLQMSSKRLLVDSVYSHAAAAMDLPSTVLWVMTEPEMFGYKMHDNIMCNEPELHNMDRLEQLFSGLDANTDKCPFGQEQKVFDTQQIIASLKQ